MYIGQGINENKAKLLVKSNRLKNRTEQNRTMGDYNFEIVDKFNYLSIALSG